MNDAMVVGGLFVVLGMALLAGVGRLCLAARQSASWPSTSGRIVSSDREASTGRRKRYPPGGDVTVWYDPRRPERCTLVKAFGDAPFYPTLSVPSFSPQQRLRRCSG
jgi:hypothetical protein